MRRIPIITTCLALLLAASALTGCSDDDKYDVDGTDDNLVFIAPKDLKTPYSCNVMTTPAGVFGRVGADIDIKLQYASEANVRVSAHANADAKLVEKYNADHGTAYQMPPADIIQAMNGGSAEIKAGESVTETPVSVVLDESKLDAFRSDGAGDAPQYIIPVSISYDGADGKADRPLGLSTQYNTAYIIVSTSKADDFTSVVGNKTVSSNIVKTPVGVFGGISASVKIKNLIPVTGDMQGTFAVDNSLVAAYNADNGTNFSQLPDNILQSLVITPATVKEGDTESEDGIKVSVPDNLAQQLDGAFLLPLRLKTSFANGAKVDEDDIVYITVEVKNSLINDNAESIPGTKADLKEFTIVSADNLDPAGYSGLFGGGWSASWPFGGKADKASFTLDLGKERALTAFYVDSYVKKDVTVSFSADGKTWNEIGNTSEHQAAYDYNTYNQAYVLYGAVKMRYMKFDFKLDLDSWAWSYGSYASVRSLSLLFN